MSKAQTAKTTEAGVQTVEAPVPATGTSLLDGMLETQQKFVDLIKPDDTAGKELAESAFKEFLANTVKPDQIISKDVEANLKWWINEIDKKLSAQLNEIMHHPDFQKLEGTWRGLHYLVDQTETGEFLKLRVMNVSKRELFKDLERAIEFDQSQMFKKVYEEEYGILGGHPFGMLVGDYEFDRHPEDVAMLQKIAGVAAAAHAPFVAAVAPKMFGLEDFTSLPKPRDLTKIFGTVEYAAWKSFREHPDSRYVALSMPRVLARMPYGDDFKRVDEFRYEEGVDGTDHKKYQWMNAAWAYAARVTDAFAKDGWFGRTRGVEGGGKVENLPVHTFKTDDGEIAMKCPSEIAITDRREFELSNLGFLPLIHYKNRDCAAFIGTQTCQRPKEYFDNRATSNAALSTKLNYMLCVSRFAHYLKVMARDKIGSYMEVKDCEKWLNSWISNYVILNPEIAGEELKAQSPLADARIDVEAVPGKPGWYRAIAYLRPHFQLETLTASMRLVAEIPKKK